MNFNALFKLHKKAHWPMDHERMAVGSFGGLPWPYGRREGSGFQNAGVRKQGPDTMTPRGPIREVVDFPE
jgi:hypothetical protein